ncbi:MAG: SdpI family protein [Bacteroidota bacterium]
MTSQDWILYFLLGPLLVLIVTLVNIFPPKQINDVYGYRTARSKRDQKSWDEAQRFSGRISLWLFIGLSFIELPLFMFIEAPNAGLISTGLLVIACLLLFLLTERHLKKF